MTNRPRIVAFDLDSTIAHTHHREHLAPAEDRHVLSNWIAYSKACVDDGVIEGVAAAARLFSLAGFQIVFISGRNVEALDETASWLTANDIPYDLIRLHGENDPRHNAEHKVKFIKELQVYADVSLMFEDHIVVCEQIEAETGVPCITVRPRHEDGVGVSFNLNQYTDKELGKVSA